MNSVRTNTIAFMVASGLATGLLGSSSANADSVYAQLDSATGNVATFDLRQNFDSLIVGGGVTLTLSGPISLYGAGFTPAADPAHSNDVYLTDATRVDPAFSGHSALAVHWGHFAGVTGQWLLGTIQVTINGPGTGQIVVNDDPLWGGWSLASGVDANVIFTPPFAGQDQISSVPLPAAAWLFGSALGLFGVRRHKQTTG
jgi:hypothetical protein